MFNKILGSGILIAAGIGAVGLWGQGRPSRLAAGLPAKVEAGPMVTQPTGKGGSGYQPGVPVQGHYRSNGPYVAPHQRSHPDHNFANNWSTAPNVNPYTGRTGTRHSPSPTPGHGSSRGGSPGRGGRGR